LFLAISFGMTTHSNKTEVDKNRESEEGRMMGKVKEDFIALADSVDKKIKQLEEKEARWAQLEAHGRARIKCS
jgi:hypothetical protein